MRINTVFHAVILKATHCVLSKGIRTCFSIETPDKGKMAETWSLGFNEWLAGVERRIESKWGSTKESAFMKAERERERESDRGKSSEEGRMQEWSTRYYNSGRESSWNTRAGACALIRTAVSTITFFSNPSVTLREEGGLWNLKGRSSLSTSNASRKGLWNLFSAPHPPLACFFLSPPGI